MDRRKIVAITNSAKPLTACVRKQLKKPAMYQVVLLNDDYTPMDFVIEILQKFFSMEVSRATRIMLQVHKEGKAICGSYTKDIAETKVTLVNECARMDQYPLLCCMEKL